MIEKRYQHYTKDGVVWTPWREYQKKGSSELAKQLNRDEHWQLKSSKLLNEFRYVE